MQHAFADIESCHYNRNKRHPTDNHAIWEFHDPEMEVLYQIRLYVLMIFPHIGLTQSINMVSTSKIRFLK